MHTLAIGHSPIYLSENAGALRQDWPRVPLPATAELLCASAALGRQLAALLDPEQEVPGVTSGTIRPELREIGAVRTPAGTQLDLAVTAGWGHAGQSGVTMPGRGRLTSRAYTPEEQAALATGAAELDLTAAQATALLGAETFDVFLNGAAYWANLPANVWAYTIGGYQVIKKWLSYREHDLLGRALTVAEARHVAGMARRIAAILLLGPTLDASYRAVCQQVWQGSQGAAGDGG
jgi:hypothetical protein